MDSVRNLQDYMILKVLVFTTRLVSARVHVSGKSQLKSTMNGHQKLLKSLFLPGATFSLSTKGVKMMNAVRLK